MTQDEAHDRETRVLESYDEIYHNALIERNDRQLRGLAYLNRIRRNRVLKYFTDLGDINSSLSH